MKTYAMMIPIAIFLNGIPASFPEMADGHTEVIPCLSQHLSQQNNILYSPTFRASWTLLKEEIVGEDIRLRQPDPLVHCLNGTPYHPPLNKEWFFKAGYIENGIIDQIQESLENQFGITEPDLDLFKKEREGIVCYSYLKTSVRFKYPFQSLQWKFMNEEKEVTVSCFGLPKFGERPDPVGPVRKQVRLFDYKHANEFIIQIPDADSAKELILAKIPFQDDLLTTVANVMGRIQYKFMDELTRLDELIIPKINLSVEQHYQELEGKYLTNNKFTDYFFVLASQQINFSMDESGAVAEVNGQIIKIKGSQSRILAFDKPFLVILRSVGALEPDLVIWVANADFLLPVR